MNSHIHDILIIGGGINGAAIAADAAHRGLDIVLCEKNDLGSGTSSASSQLIHGGLRYLEQYDFKLVRKSLKEREILLHKAPFLISPLEFIIPMQSLSKPSWLIRSGLWIYDHLNFNNSLPRSKAMALSQGLTSAPLKNNIQKGFSYWDCHVDDARLVILNALAAKEKGATILPHTQFIQAKRHPEYWEIELKNHHEESYIVHARLLVNATGPWVRETSQKIHSSPIYDIELVKGSHMIVPKLYEGNHAYLLQNKDGRIVFVLPYFNEFNVIGTTEIDYAGTLNHVAITEAEKDYLCHCINQYFEKSLNASEIIQSYSGIRPLVKQNNKKNSSEMSRDYDLQLDESDGLAPLLTVLGGKLTTHRQLGEECLLRVKKFFLNAKNDSTRNIFLPGGSMSNFENFYQTLRVTYPWLNEKILFRYAKQYGSRIHELLFGINDFEGLRIAFSEDLYEREVEFLIEHEWAESAEDVLWRRTKLGLFFNKIQIQKL
ncbi:MAG: glycerol-3-phosphate dehydrogenase, partial [Proteobacteria bacterium]|nr:glycerol-3-phosphate dehydrogenase [Pseudomonadota bacterium]